MKKSLFFISVICAIFSVNTWAEAGYVLSTSEQTALQQAVQKIQAQPIRVQEAVIVALKKRTPGITDERKRILYSALERELRQKTASGDVLATNLEKKEIIQAITSQKKEEKIGSATIQISGDIVSKQEGAVSFQGTITADVDIQDTKKPKVRLQVEVSGKNQENTLDVSAEMRLIDTVGYVILKKFSFTPDDEQISFFIKPYLNVWWSIPLDDFSAQEIESSIEQTNLQNQKIRDVFLQKDIIPKLLYKGQQSSSSRYAGIVDNMALVEMIASTAQLQGDIMTEADKKELQDIVKDLIIQSDFTVDANEKISHLMTTVTMKNKIIDEDILNGSFTMSLATSPNIHPILVPETSHDMSKIASDF